MLDTKAPWRQRFLNIIERTIVELNIEFTNFTLGQAANGETRKRFFDASVQGIEFADELTVCSAIVNDCLSSPIFSGDVEKSNDDKNSADIKFYKVQRETPYSEDSRHRVDITTQRISKEEILYEASGKKDSLVPTFPVYEKSYIEAKRAKRYPNSSLESITISGNSSTAGELRIATESRLEKYYQKDRFFYVLVWGVWNNSNESKNKPEEYLNSFRQTEKFIIKEDDINIRWIPLTWPIINQLNPPDTSINPEKWCWILLAQVTKS